MKVAFITHYSAMYGANRSLLSLVEGLAARGIEPFVVAPYEGDFTAALQERKIPVFIAPYQYWFGPAVKGGTPYQRLVRWLVGRRDAHRRLASTCRGVFPVVRQLRRWNVELVYSNSSVIAIGAMASKVMRIPHVWHLREFMALHYGMSYDWGKRLTHRLISRSHAQICVSHAIARHFAVPEPAHTQHVVYNGVLPGARFDELKENAQRQSYHPGTYTFALVGLVHRSKGQHTAIKALAALQRTVCCEVRLILAGAGDTRHLERLARKAGVRDRVEFRGHLDDPYQAYLAADAVLMCSRHEGMGRVTVEAMAACRPVIGYDDAGTAELIEDGVTGLLYRGGYRSLAACMQRLVEDREWARALGVAGWEHARQHFTVEQYAADVEAILRQAAAG